MRPEWNLLLKSFPVVIAVATRHSSRLKWYAAFLEVEEDNINGEMYFQQRVETVYEFALLSDCFQKTKPVDFERLITKATLEEREVLILSWVNQTDLIEVDRLTHHSPIRLTEAAIHSDFERQWGHQSTTMV